MTAIHTAAPTHTSKRALRRMRAQLRHVEAAPVDPVYAAIDHRIRYHGDRLAEMLARPMPTLIDGIGFVWPDDPDFDALITRVAS